jgi:hypothetical protein
MQAVKVGQEGREGGNRWGGLRLRWPIPYRVQATPGVPPRSRPGRFCPAWPLVFASLVTRWSAKPCKGIHLTLRFTLCRKVTQLQTVCIMLQCCNADPLVSVATPSPPTLSIPYNLAPFPTIPPPFPCNLATISPAFPFPLRLPSLPPPSLPFAPSPLFLCLPLSLGELGNETSALPPFLDSTVMILETKTNLPFSLGYQRQRWPQASHHVIRWGSRESRAIVPHGESPRLVGLVALLVSGLFLP